MKVCLVNCVDTPRSEVDDVGYYLSRRGHEITIIYPDLKRRTFEKNGIKRISFKACFLPKIHYTIPNIIEEYNILINKLKKENYDIIQACDYDYLTSLGPILIKKRFDTPILLTTDAFPGVSWFYGNKFVDLVGKIYTNSLGQFILNSYDKLLFLYKDLSRQAIFFGIEGEKIHVIPNGVDFEQFNANINGSIIRSYLDVKEDEKIILFVGRLALVKRVDILIESTKILSKYGYKIRTIIIGDGPYKEMYKRMAGKDKNILFLGRICKNDLPAYYAASDIFVLPSLSEGLPTVLLEAAASGKPIVASNVGGISDIVRHKSTGFLVEPGDVMSFVYYIKLLLDDENLAYMMGYNACKHAKRNFNWDGIIEKYENIYRNV